MNQAPGNQSDETSQVNDRPRKQVAKNLKYLSLMANLEENREALVAELINAAMKSPLPQLTKAACKMPTTSCRAAANPQFERPTGTGASRPPVTRSTSKEPAMRSGNLANDKTIRTITPEESSDSDGTLKEVEEEPGLDQRASHSLAARCHKERRLNSHNHSLTRSISREALSSGRILARSDSRDSLSSGLVRSISREFSSMTRSESCEFLSLFNEKVRVSGQS